MKASNGIESLDATPVSSKLPYNSPENSCRTSSTYKSFLSEMKASNGIESLDATPAPSKLHYNSPENSCRTSSTYKSLLSEMNTSLTLKRCRAACSITKSNTLNSETKGKLGHCSAATSSCYKSLESMVSPWNVEQDSSKIGEVLTSDEEPLEATIKPGKTPCNSSNCCYAQMKRRKTAAKNFKSTKLLTNAQYQGDAESTLNVQQKELTKSEPLPMNKFLNLSPFEVHELLSRDDIGVHSEQQILDHALMWIFCKWPERELFAELILSSIRWTLLTNRELLDFILNSYHADLFDRPGVQEIILITLVKKLALEEMFTTTRTMRIGDHARVDSGLRVLPLPLDKCLA